MSSLDPDALTRAATSAQDAMDAIGFPTPLCLQGMIHAVEQQRGRPMRVVELGALAGDEVCGVWLLTDREDIILHAPSTSRLHLQQFVLHELAHIILQHDALSAAPMAGAGVLLPDLAGERVRRRLNRSRFSDETEVAAEILADLLAESIRSSRRERSRFLQVFA